MKKIVSANQMQQADRYTIEHEPVSSLLLMERAAKACFNWMRINYSTERNVKIFCGTGNNGGDGLVIADYLLTKQSNVIVYIIRHSNKCSEDFLENEKRLIQNFGEHVFNIHSEADFPLITDNDLIVDAIFGTGLNKKTEGLFEKIIQHLNNSTAEIVAIDLPSGLQADSFYEVGSAIIMATYTLTFQLKKVAFYFPYSYQYTGDVQVMDIKLLPQFFNGCESDYFETEEDDISKLLKKRTAVAHKGTFGHALLICGGYGKMGAAVLAAKACLRSGVGLLTTNIPLSGYTILQTAVPETMVITDSNTDFLTQPIPTDLYNAIGIGCGIGTHDQTINLVLQVLEANKTLVIDADAINCIALRKELLKKIPPNAILTPHIKEFERLTEKATNDFHRNQLQRKFSLDHNCFVVLKGRFTCITTPEGKCYFNPTGNAGMATAGSGDVLTGILTSLLAQGYSPFETCLIGVYLHGMAGDFAADNVSQSFMIASDIINSMSLVYKYFERLK